MQIYIKIPNYKPIEIKNLLSFHRILAFLSSKCQVCYSFYYTIFIMNICPALTAFFDNKPEALPVYVKNDSIDIVLKETYPELTYICLDLEENF